MGVSNRRDQAIILALNDWVPFGDAGASMREEEFIFIKDNDGK